MRKPLWAALAALFVCATAAGQGNLYGDSVLRPTATISGASVRACTKAATGTPCSPLATIYTDEALTNQIAGSTVTADSRGRFQFYSAETCLQLQFSAAGFATLTVPACSPSTSSLAVTQVVTFSATPTFDTSANRYFRMTLIGNVTSSTIGGAVTGRVAYFNLCQDATGGRTFAWPASVLNPPYLDPAASQCTSADMIYDGTNWRPLSPTSTCPNGARCVDGVKYQIADIGDGINDAYADLPSSGGIIVVPAGSYSYTTPIVFATLNKFVVLQGAASQGVTLTYTPSTGTAITFNTGNSGLPIGQGLRDIKLVVTNSTARGVLVGGSNGAVGWYGLNYQISGGGPNLELGSNVQGMVSDHCVIAEGSQGFLFPSGLTQTGEGIEFRSCWFSHATEWKTNYVQITSQAADNADVTFFNCHLDSVQYVQSNGDVKFYKLHMENPSNFSIGANYYASITGGVASFYDPFMVSQQVNVPTGFINVGAATANVFGANFQNTSSAIIGVNVGATGTLNFSLKNTSGTFTPLLQTASGALLSRLDHLGLSLLGGNSASPSAIRANTGQTVSGITGTLLGWLQEGVAHLGEIDTSGNVGILGSSQAKRFKAAGGTALVAGDFALSAGWGTTASVGTITGTDQGFQFVVTSAGTGQGANPTITVTDKDGTWTNSPIVIVKRSAGSQLTIVDTWTVTATALTITFNGTPVAAETFTYNVIKMGR